VLYDPSGGTGSQLFLLLLLLLLLRLNQFCKFASDSTVELIEPFPSNLGDKDIENETLTTH